MRAYSYSQLRRFNECPAAWKFEKIDKIQQERSRPMIVGGAAHTAIEKYLDHCLRERLPSDAGAIDGIAEKLTLDRGAPCPEDVRREVAELLTKFSESYAVKLTRPELEGKVAFGKPWNSTAWFGKSVRFRAVMDLVDVVDGVVKITDWKTGQRIPPTSEVKEDPQLLTYAYCASVLYPDVDEFEVSLYHVRFGFEQGPFTFYRDDLEWVREDLERQMAAIDAEQDFAATPGPHCEYCNFRRHCPVYQGSGRGDIPEDTAELVAEFFALKARLKDVEAAAKARVEAEGPVPCGAGKVLGFVGQESVSIVDVGGACEDLLAVGVAEADLYRALTLSKTKLVSLLKKADAKDRIEGVLAERGQVTMKSVFKAHKEAK